MSTIAESEVTAYLREKCATNDGGPAFPHDGQANYTGGMSLRDYFAGQVLAGIMADSEYRGSDVATVKACYALADAMLAARNAKPEAAK